MCKRTIKYSILLFIIIFSTTVFAEEVKYPPYPDVWGREFPRLGNDRNRGAVFWIYQEKNGDYLITFAKHGTKQKRADGTCCDYKSTRSSYHFFAGTEREFKSREESEQFQRMNRKNNIEDQGSIVFKNDIKLVRDSVNCLGIFPCIKKIKNNKVIATYYLIYVLDSPIKRGVNRYAERNDGLNKDTIDTYVEGLYPSFVPLKDETFLIHRFLSDAVVRFDSNLNSKSSIVGTRLFVLDQSVFLEISKKIYKEKGLNDQTLADGVYEYILNLRREKK
jgi:hypothetical protein